MTGSGRDRGVRLGIAMICALGHSALADVSALGRLEPRNGIIHLTAPVTPESVTGVVLAELLVAAGDRVSAGQLVAITEPAALLAELEREAEIAVDVARREAHAAAASADAACVRADAARREADRRASLLERRLGAEEEFERASATASFEAASCTAARAATSAAEGAVALADARRARQHAALERARVRAPMDALVLRVATRPGELIGHDGILELGDVDHMYAIAEIYETDVAAIASGQRARITSDALAEPLSGIVEHVRLQVRKQDVLDTDPAARKDARIVEVEIRIDEPASAARLSNLQVEIVIET